MNSRRRSLLAAGVCAAAVALHHVPAVAYVDLPPVTVPNADAESALRALEDGLWLRALDGFPAALALQPSNPDFHGGAGFAYRKLGRMDPSFRHYREALAIDPNHRGAHEYIGEACLAVGEKDKVREHLERLEATCGRGCDEYRGLAAVIAAAR